MLKHKLQEELKQAMLARNELKTSVLRLLLSAINYHEIQKGGAGYQATDEDIFSVIQKQIKSRKESIEQFQKGKRQDLADKETKELEILNSYLPKQIPEEELKLIIEETLKATGAKTIFDMGKVMGALLPKLKGRADLGLVSKIVKEKLSY